MTLPVGALLIVAGACFHYLTVADDGDGLLVRFGPLPLFRKRIRYADMQAAELGRTTVLDGWGVRYRLGKGGGWIWNIRGLDCVIIDHGARTLVGTDDGENLLAFLKTKLPGAKA